MITIGSLFSGIGGLESVLEAAGMKTIWQCERDPYARAILAQNFPGVPCYDDITRLDPDAIERPELLCGGFPCQPHSLLGKRAGSADERDMWGEFVRIIDRLRPRWVVAENVASILTTDNGRFFKRILADLDALGFDAEWSVISACAVGAPHTRDRLFIVSHANGQQYKSNSPALGRQATAPVYPGGRAEWPPEPTISRVAYGIPNRLDRIRCLGNAVVPAVAETLGRLIVAANQASQPNPNQEKSNV